jgi:hypothetical protein
MMDEEFQGLIAIPSCRPVMCQISFSGLSR